jgi:L-asparaginase
MQSKASTIVILGTGGTIAGAAASAADHVGYTAGQIGVAQLVAAVPSLAAVPLQCEQLAQLDSKDMDFATWQRLAQRVAELLARDDVQGIVVTHGTDTLEETAYFLHRVLAPAKPVVLTAAMRPATALSADGPQNLRDAVTVAQEIGARGVCAVFAGTVFHPVDLRKVHTYRVDAFAAGDAGPIARVEQDQVRRFRDWPAGDALGVAAIARDAATWPRVEIVLNHAGADGRIVDALLAQGLDGLVVAGTGNGTLSIALANAVARAQAAGVRIVRASRCAQGPVIGGDNGAGELSAVQARIALLLELLAR